MKVLETFNSLPDQNGIYQKTTIYQKDEFTKIKEIKTIKKTKIIEKVHKNVLKRKKEWKPFGKALNSNNKLVTFKGDDIKIEYKDNGIFNYKNYKDSYTNEFNIFDGIEINLEEKKLKQETKSTKQKYVPIKLFKPRNRDSNNITNKNNIKDNASDNKSNKYVFKPKKRDENDNSHKKKLFIENLDPEFREDDIADYIRHLGDIKDICIIRDKYTGQSKCFGFITLYKNKVAQAIIDNFNKKPMGSMIVNIKYAEDKKKR